jgi:hypothetical protein
MRIAGRVAEKMTLWALGDGKRKITRTPAAGFGGR